jgi:hypothetical protein
MGASSIHPDLVRVALERIEGRPFERFSQEFLSAAYGVDFIPLGGDKDGGADGLFTTGEGSGSDHFMQASVVEDFRGKIRKTISDLARAGRTVRELLYATSRRVPKLDIVEQELSAELGATIRIRDATYFEIHINQDSRTRASFDHHLEPAIEFLQRIGETPIRPKLSASASPAVYVFLRQELDRQAGNLALADATVDALIVWALEDTDPALGKLLGRQAILERIEQVAPAVTNLVASRLDSRLAFLSHKQGSRGRAINWHHKVDLYCLPYSQRQLVQSANAADMSLRSQVLDQWEESLGEALGPSTAAGLVRQATQVAARALEVIFARQGMEFAHFICRDRSTDSGLTVSDAIVAAVSEIGVARVNANVVATAVQEVLRRSFFEPTHEQQDFFGRLSRTYSLLFALEAEPRVAQYFDELAGDFYLYVGADMLVSALAERYLPPEGQMVMTSLAVAARAGATLVLTEPVLGEVVHHLRLSDADYREQFKGLTGHVPIEITEQSPRILIRAFFRAQETEAVRRAPLSWQSFLNHICEYADLNSRRAFRVVRDYLIDKFEMQYVERTELTGLVDAERVKALAAALAREKANAELAENDALLALAVYGRRRQQHEATTTSVFGFRTWWLTGETAIQRYSTEVVKSEGGDRYMMRPEFLLNFIALAPSVAKVRRSYANVFPSALGIRLGRQMDEAEFQKMMNGVASAMDLDEPRRNASIGATVDHLKGDFTRRYGVDVGGGRRMLASLGAADPKAERA